MVGAAMVRIYQYACNGHSDVAGSEEPSQRTPMIRIVTSLAIIFFGLASLWTRVAEESAYLAGQ
jgi:hypothetical protein